MQSLATVTRLHVNSVYNDIQIFLNRYKENTAREYKRDIDEYFMFMNGKSLEQLIQDDVEYVYVGERKEKLLLKHAEEYKNYLKSKHIDKDATVMRKIASVRALYKFLAANGYQAPYIVFDTKGLNNNPNSYDVLSKEQVERLAELALEEEYYADELHVFIYLAAQTSVRVSALLDLTWDDVNYNEDAKFYEVKVVDKRDDHRKCPVDKWLYNKMKKLNDSSDSNKVFPNLKMNYINKVIRRIAYGKIGISQKLRIVSHSLRKSAPTYEIKTTGDIKRGMLQTNHKSVETFMNTYVDNTVNYNELAGIRMFRKMDEGLIDLVNKEELVELLKKTNPNAYQQLLIEIQKIVE